MYDKPRDVDFDCVRWSISPGYEEEPQSAPCVAAIAAPCGKGMVVSPSNR
ncbi:hypothetical protein LLE49_12485 [Alicyclobacillus tolerans]|nr:hypothetical protein [Alicyclobacillus tolerans]MCF8565534.1 hypothetical protein [Alicyclobacillus tolerans]